MNIYYCLPEMLMEGDYKEPVNITKILFGVHKIGNFTLLQILQQTVLLICMIISCLQQNTTRHMCQIFQIFKYFTLHPFSLHTFFENLLHFLLVFVVHFVKDEISHFLHLRLSLKVLNSTGLMTDKVKPKLVA
jgi:hypothetical protein